MNTTIYWKSNYSHQDSAIHYEMQYHDTSETKWIPKTCTNPQWHNHSREFSCGLLTCNTTKVDEFYQIRVKAQQNSSDLLVTPSVVHNPTTNNVPAHITDVHLIRFSSTVSVLSWQLPLDFCAKSKYCMEYYYHKEGANKNKSLSIPENTNLSHLAVMGLDCSKHLFYLTVYEQQLCSFSPSARWTTGPFILPSQNPVAYLNPALRVLNLNAVIYWRGSCSVNSSEFSVYYRQAYVNDQSWTRSTCAIKKDGQNVFSCQFLSCAMVSDHDYEVQVRVNGTGQPENILYFQPSLENIPDQIKNVKIVALTSTTVQVTWKLPTSFCSKFPYCLTFDYHARNVNMNQSVEISDKGQQQKSVIIRNLLPYTKYYFYAITFPDVLGCLYEAGKSLGATGPFAGTTREAVPSSPPVLICGLCDVTVHGRMRSGTVRWKLPPRTSWNGLPRVFIIEWQVKSERNTSKAKWYNKTVTNRLATEGNLTGLFSAVEYVVRVKMCNGELCSKFSKEMTIDVSEQKVPRSQSSRVNVVAVSVSVLSILVVIFALWLCRRLYRLRAARNNATAGVRELPDLGCLSYENISPYSLPSYSQLSAMDECPLEEESFTKPEADKKSESVSQVGEDITRIATGQSDIL